MDGIPHTGPTYPCGQSRARQAIIPSGQLNNRLSEYVHIMGRSRMQLFSGVHDIEDIPPDADTRLFHLSLDKGT